MEIEKKEKNIKMLNLYYENHATNTYLVYEVKEADAVDNMSIGMLTNNRIPGIASTLFTQLNNKKYIKYNVSAKVSISQIFSGIVNRKRLIGAFCGILNAMLSADDYMLDSGMILIDMDYIFMDISTSETILIYLPIINEMVSPVDLGQFFKQIMFTTQFDQTENCDHVARIINYLNVTSKFSLLDFKNLLDELKLEDKAIFSSSLETKKEQPVVANFQVKETPMKIESKSQPIIYNPSSSENSSFNVPKVSSYERPKSISNKVDAALTATETQETSDQQEITFLYLMQHYNKENAAAYRAQKEAKKKSGGKVKAKNNTRQLNRDSSVSSVDFGFAIPGKSSSIQSMSGELSKSNTFEQNNGYAFSSYSIDNTTSYVQNNKMSHLEEVAKNQNSSSQSLYEQSVFPQGASMNFGETTVLSDNIVGETTVLSLSQLSKPVYPYLIRIKFNEKISINKSVFRIGKERSYVDYFINDNPAISRSHANIVTRENKYFVIDTNSTNHTFVNGKMIPSNSEIEIEDGTKIRFANEEFEFKIS